MAEKKGWDDIYGLVWFGFDFCSCFFLDKSILNWTKLKLKWNINQRKNKELMNECIDEKTSNWNPGIDMWTYILTY